MSALVERFAVEKVPSGEDFTGILRTKHASPPGTLAGVLLGICGFMVFMPLFVELVAAVTWLVTGRQGTVQEIYKSFGAFTSPLGVASTQLGIALLIPLAMLLIVTINHVRPGYLFSVVGHLRWRPLWIFLGVALVTMNLVLVATDKIMGKSFTITPQPDLSAFLIAIFLTTPLQAAAEEVFFRGYLLESLGSLVPNRWFGIVCSALLFAVFHGSQNPWLFAERFAFGVLAAWLVVELGGIEAGIGAHVINNLCAFTYAGLTTGIPQLRAVTQATPADAIGELVMYAVFTAVAWLVGRRLHLERTTA